MAVLLFLSICIICVDTYYEFLLKDNIYIMAFVLLGLLYIIFYVFSYISNIILIKCLRKYILKTEEFEGGVALALIITETEDDIVIKCEDSYPIILPKSKISAYMDVSELNSSQIKCLMGLQDEYEENIDDKKQKGKLKYNNTKVKLKYYGYQCIKED